MCWIWSNSSLDSRHSRWVSSVSALLALVTFSVAVEARQPSSDKSAAALLVSVPHLSHPPKIDGTVDVGEWEGAARLSDFVQIEPAEGQPATERTEVWLGQDARSLYVLFVAFDSQMAQLRATRTPRDQLPWTDDWVSIFIDPHQTRTRCFTFVFNALGVQRDGIWSRDNDFTWDTVLTSKGSIQPDRFVVEAAIPFASLLAGSAGQPRWDVNFVRWIPRKGEESWWAPLQRKRSNEFLTQFGQLAGLGGEEATTAVEVIPTATGKVGTAGTASSTTDGRFGLTVRLPVSSAGRLEATYRPDFSNVESDVGQIEFNERYALFYPEKRPFFLENKDLFETPRASFVSDPLRLVHTRTLVRPRYGVRWLATPARSFVGALFTAEDRLSGGADGTSAIVRGLHRWANSSQAGVTFTRRTRPTTSNVVLAGDALLRLPASSLLTLQAAWSRDETPSSVPARSAAAAYVDFAREDGRSFQQVVVRVVPRAFRSELGFIPRTDVRQVVSHVGLYRRPRGSRLLYALPMFQHVISLDDHGNLVDNEYLPHVEFQFTRLTKLWFGYRLGDEVFREQRYRVGRFEPRFESAPTRWLNLSVRGRFGTRLRYDRREATDASFVAGFREVQATADLKVGRNFTGSALAVWQTYDGRPKMPATRVWLARTRLAYQFDNHTYVRGIWQWDSDTRRREFSVLAARVINYGTQVHVGFEFRSSTTDGSVDDLVGRSVVFVRISYLLRR